jgi:hypothetical protein
MYGESMGWIVLYKTLLQWLAFGLLTGATVIQLLVNIANQRQDDMARAEMQQSQVKIQASVDQLAMKFDELRSVENLERYLQPIKIEALKKYVSKKDLGELQNYLKDFSNDLETKNVDELKKDVSEILKIIPVDPYFRVYKLLLQYGLFQGYLSGQFKIVQIVRWDWVVGSGEKASLYVLTTDESGKDVSYGPLTNNTMTMLDQPISRFIQIKVESSGVGSFEFHPRSFRIGWAIAQRKTDSSWGPIPGLAEDDPYFRISSSGNLEF